MTAITQIADDDTGLATRSKLNKLITQVIDVTADPFNAAGDGVTDELAAIQAAVDWTVLSAIRGVIYFPPGTYYVSGPIDTASTLTQARFLRLLGCMGLSTIIGNFADYIIKSYYFETQSFSGGHLCEKLTIINQHASGGGIRWGTAVGAAIRDCDITANFGISTDNTDRTDSPAAEGAYFGSLEVSIENCHLRAYDALAAGSTGLARGANGPTTNCTFKDFYTAVRTFGGQGGMAFQGCRFEHNNYGLANSWGPTQVAPGGAATTSGIEVFGCYFKNNGVAIYAASGGSNYIGILIEAADGSIPGNPQYGIQNPAGGLGLSAFIGITITGAFDEAGIEVVGGEGLKSPGTFTGVSVNNTGSGDDWSFPSTAMTIDLDGCNTSAVWTMSKLPAKTYNVISASWSSGTGKATIGLTGAGDLQNPAVGNVTLSGISPAGYNGTFTDVEVLSFFEIAITMADPGSYVSGGTGFYAAERIGGSQNVYEGETYNVSDANTATWGAAALGGGSNHAKLRYTPAAWTVVGK